MMGTAKRRNGAQDNGAQDNESQDDRATEPSAALEALGTPPGRVPACPELWEGSGISCLYAITYMLHPAYMYIVVCLRGGPLPRWLMPAPP